MLNPYKFVGQDINVFGIFSTSAVDNLVLIPDDSFKGLSRVYQTPYSIFISSKFVQENERFADTFE